MPVAPYHLVARPDVAAAVGAAARADRTAGACEIVAGVALMVPARKRRDY